MKGVLWNAFYCIRDFSFECNECVKVQLWRTHCFMSTCTASILSLFAIEGLWFVECDLRAIRFYFFLRTVFLISPHVDMAWLSGLADKAENLLNKIDQNTAAVLNKDKYEMTQGHLSEVTWLSPESG